MIARSGNARASRGLEFGERHHPFILILIGGDSRGDAGPYAALVLERIIPAQIADLVGEPPLTRLEDLSAYRRLLATFIGALADPGLAADAPGGLNG